MHDEGVLQRLALERLLMLLGDAQPMNDSAILTQTLRFGFGAVQVSTAWQTPNVISMPVEALRSLSRSE